MANHTTHKRYNRFKNAEKISPRFFPRVYFEGENIYAGCAQLSVTGKLLTEMQEAQWLVILHKWINDNWDIDSNDLNVELEPENFRYRITFVDDEKFVMIKLIHYGI